MIVVKVEIWPHGDPKKKRLLGSAVITNDGSGTKTQGNYHYVVMGKNEYTMKNGIGNYEGFPRTRLHAWHLIKRILDQCL